jgi:hypothetical protein
MYGRVLCQMAENGHEAMVQQLLKHMANVNVKDNDEWTAATPGG